MNMKLGLVVAGVLLVSVCSLKADERAVSDAQDLNEAYSVFSTNEYRQLFSPGYFGSDFDDQVEAIEEHLGSLERFERNDLPRLKEMLEQFANRYGEDRVAIRRHFQELSNQGVSVAGDPGYWWEELTKIAVAPVETRSKVAEELTRKADSAGQTHQGYNIMTVEESYAQAKRFLEFAVEYDPNNREAKRRLGEIESELTERLAADQKKIDETEFGSHATSFQGPGTAEEMAKKVTEYLSNIESGKDGAVLAVRISGDWAPADENLLGDTLTWGLPVEVAYRQDDDPDTARVYSMELITRDNKQEPPFQRYRLGSSWFVRVSNLPGHGKSKAAAAGFGLLRFPLAMMLMIIGLFASAPLLESKVPALTGVISKLRPYGAFVGIATLALGLLAMLLSIFSPFRDVLPQLAAVGVGFVMGVELLLKWKPSTAQPAEQQTADETEQEKEATTDSSSGNGTDLASAAQETFTKAGELAKQGVDRAQTLLVAHEDQLKKLDLIRVPLGIACLVLGFAHLLIGGYLFV